MNLKLAVQAVLVSSFLPGSFLAAQALESACETNSSPSGIVLCAARLHPLVRRQEALRARARADAEAAVVYPNPEIEGEVSSGPSGEFAYLHPIELGDRRELRGDEARKRESAAAARLELVRQDAALETIELLFRLRQSFENTRMLSEARDSFGVALNRLARSAVLTPSRRAELLTVRLALRTSEQRLALLETERLHMEQRLELILGSRLESEPVLSALVRRDQTWPEDVPGELATPEVEASRLEAAAAAAHARLEESQVWPVLRIGPRVGYETASESDLLGNRSRRGEFDYGVAFRLELPLYNQNAGAIESAREMSRASSIDHQTLTDRIAAEAARLHRSYRAYRVQLSRSAPPENVVQDGRLIAGYLARGIIPPGTLVEYYRTQLDYVRDYQELEIAALQSLWRLRALKGQILDPEVLRELDASPGDAS
ncbi:MAG: TolC family protein [Spirochaetales bacterium]|nr:TolC family protein [Leptospiraceae bacterium]MCP5481509.1 TolC family protein [Spirochaetales bacterium]MCP5484338.1 TolC family protein [Spirochaetales bacterium]